MLSTGTIKKERRNTEWSCSIHRESRSNWRWRNCKIHNYLDTEKIEQEALYDGMYAVTTDLLDDDVKDILKVSEGLLEYYADILEMPILTFWNIGFIRLCKYIGISHYRDVISHYYSISFDEYETIYEISDVDDEDTV